VDGEIFGMNWNVLVPRNLRWARPAWPTIAITAGVIVVLGMLATGAWLWNAAQTQHGSAAYAATLILARQTDTPGAAAATKTAATADLERVLAQYPSHPMAAEAAYALGNLRFGAGQYDRARAAWQVAVAKSGAGTLRTLAHAGIGYAWEAERKLPEATHAYEAELARLTPTDFYYEELLFDLARVQELAGKKDAAVATYRRILKDVPKTVRAEEIRTQLANLGATP
jgi:tetratricopeptide (TPR) repeat protein